MSQRPDPDLPPEQVSKVIDEMHRRDLSAPDRARTSAQLGGGLASTAFIGTLFASGNLHLFDEPLWVTLLGVLSLVAWLVATGLFVFAAMARSWRPAEPGSTFREMVKARLAAAKSEADTVRRRALIALIPVAAAIVLTGTTTSAAAEAERVAEYRVVLTTEGAETLHELCHSGTSTVIYVTAAGNSMKLDPAEFTLKEPACGDKAVSLGQRLLSGFAPR